MGVDEAYSILQSIGSCSRERLCNSPAFMLCAQAMRLANDAISFRCTSGERSRESDKAKVWWELVHTSSG
jgi:hypothetical protein